MNQDMKIEGEPKHKGWERIDVIADSRERYFHRLEELRKTIDATAKLVLSVEKS